MSSSKQTLLSCPRSQIIPTNIPQFSTNRHCDSSWRSRFSRISGSCIPRDRKIADKCDPHFSGRSIHPPPPPRAFGSAGTQHLRASAYSDERGCMRDARVPDRYRRTILSRVTQYRAGAPNKGVREELYVGGSGGRGRGRGNRSCPRSSSVQFVGGGFLGQDTAVSKSGHERKRCTRGWMARPRGDVHSLARGKRVGARGTREHMVKP